MYLIGVHLIGVYLIDMHLMDMHLIGVHLIDMHLMGVHLKGARASQSRFTKPVQPHHLGSLHRMIQTPHLLLHYLRSIELNHCHLDSQLPLNRRVRNPLIHQTRVQHPQA